MGLRKVQCHRVFTARTVLMRFEVCTLETYATVRVRRSEFLPGEFRYFVRELTQKDVTYGEVIVRMTVWNLDVTVVLG